VVIGTVSGFGIGVLILGVGNTISDVTATGNRIGIIVCCEGSENRIVGNIANGNLSGNGVIGVGIQEGDGGRNNVIAGNTANGNDAWGILLVDQTPPPLPPKNATVTGNVASYNGDGGILLVFSAIGNVVRGNEVIGNANWGILSGSFTANFPDDNLIQGNTALDSGFVDVADFDPACANTWKSNTFSTEGGTEIGANPDCTD